MKYIKEERDEDGNLVVVDLTPEQIEMLKGFYDLPDDED